MTTLSAQIMLTAPFCHSLKDKRMVTRSIIDKTRHKYNVSIAEVGAHDVHQTIIIGVAAVSGSASYAQNILDNVIRFVENNTEAEIISVKFF